MGDICQECGRLFKEPQTGGSSTAVYCACEVANADDAEKEDSLARQHDAEEELTPQLQGKTIKELKSLLKEKGLYQTGNKLALVQRLMDASHQPSAPVSQKRADVALRKQTQRDCTMTTVKMCLKQRLNHPELMLPMVDTLVLYISQQSRVGSITVNAFLVHHLETHGRLPEWFNANNDSFLTTFFRNCFTGGRLVTGAASTHDAHLAELPTSPMLNRLRPAHISGTSQATTYAAENYTTCFKNHITVHFYDRVKGVCAHFCQKFGQSSWAPKRSQVLFPFVRYLLNTSLPEDNVHLRVPLTILSLLSPLKERIQRCWEDGRITDLNAALEVTFMIERMKRQFGFAPAASLAPIHGYGRMHVKMDAAVFSSYFVPRLKKANVFKPEFKTSTLAGENFMSMFRNIDSRSSKLGWTQQPSISTDGYSLCITFCNSGQKKETHRSQDPVSHAVFAKRSQYIGVDPGNTNVVTIAGFDGTGAPWMKACSTKKLNNASHKRAHLEQTKKRLQRSSPDLEALSSAGRLRTPCGADLYLYITALLEPHVGREDDMLLHHAGWTRDASLWANVGHKHTARSRMAAYIGYTREVDRMWASLPVRPNRPVVIVYGAARWSPGVIHATAPAPSTLVFKRCAQWLKRIGGRLQMADEYNTTKMSPYSKRALHNVYVNQQLTRGLKCDRSSLSLRLLMEGRLMRGTRMAEDGGGVWLSRDGLAALNIRETYARGTRPKYLRRPQPG